MSEEEWRERLTYIALSPFFRWKTETITDGPFSLPASLPFLGNPISQPASACLLKHLPQRQLIAPYRKIADFAPTTSALNITSVRPLRSERAPDLMRNLNSHNF